jgi:hypothetical protein
MGVDRKLANKDLSLLARDEARYTSATPAGRACPAFPAMATYVGVHASIMHTVELASLF